MIHAPSLYGAICIACGLVGFSPWGGSILLRAPLSTVTSSPSGIYLQDNLLKHGVYASVKAAQQLRDRKVQLGKLSAAAEIALN